MITLDDVIDEIIQILSESMDDADGDVAEKSYSPEESRDSDGKWTSSGSSSTKSSVSKHYRSLMAFLTRHIAAGMAENTYPDAQDIATSIVTNITKEAAGVAFKKAVGKHLGELIADEIEKNPTLTKRQLGLKVLTVSKEAVSNSLADSISEIGQIKSASGTTTVRKIVSTALTNLPKVLKMNDNGQMGVFFNLSKVDEEKRLVYGIATAEEIDKSGEICDYASTKPNYQAWSAEFQKATDGGSLGNLRVMHSKIAAGKVVDLEFDDKLRQIRVCAKVVDDNEWRKVLDGVYTGFSQGGSYVKRWDDPKNPGVKRYTAKPSELSLVDSPCLSSSRFQIMKSDGAVEERGFQPVVSEEDVYSLLMTVETLTKLAREIDPTIPDEVIAQVLDEYLLGKWDSDAHPRDSAGRFAAVGAAGGALSGAAAGALAGRAAGSALGGTVGRAAGAAAGALAAHRAGAFAANTSTLKGAAAGVKFGIKHGEKIGTAVGGVVGAAAGAYVGGKLAGPAAANVAEAARSVGGELADAAKTIGGAVHSVVDAARTASGGAVHSVVDAARTASGGVVSAVGEAGAKVAGTAADIGQNIAIRSRNAAIGALAGASATIGPAALNAGLGLISGGTAGAGVEAALTVGSGVVGGALQGAVENTKTDTHQVWHDAAATGNAASAALGTARAVKFGLSLGSKAVAAGYDTWKKAQAESAARDLASGVPGVSGKYTGGGKYTHSHDYDDIQGGAREVVPRARKIADALLDLQKIGVEMSDIEDLAKIIGAETVSESELIKSKYSDEEKSKMSEAGQAKSDGSYPIKDSEDVKNAVADYNRSGGSESDKEHIIARARAIGSEDCLPPSWGVGKSDDSSGGGNSDGGGAEKVSTADRLMKMIEDAGKLAEASLPDDADKLADQFLEILGKLSKASSKMSMDKVQAIHDHCADMGCKCGADKSVPAGDLEKLTSERDTLTETLNKMEPRIADILEKMKKQSEEIAKQSEEIQKLRKTALPPPRLHVIAKGEDVVFSQGDQSIDDLTKRVAGLSPAEKAELLVRMSLQNPQPMAGMRY